MKAIHFRRDIEFAPGSPPLSPIRRKASFARTLSTSSSSSGSFARTLSASSSSSGFTSPSFFSLEPTSTNELLTVFQSAPLVYQDNNGKFQPVGMLDFDRERKDLTKALSQTEIKVDLAFDFANTDRLFNFLTQGKGRVLHYSGHGHPDYLAIEDDWGKMHRLNVEDLEEWIKIGGGSLELVFVSACHSRKAGEAFVAAGVKHVVCCQHDDQLIRNDAAIEFEKAFYQDLANGKTISQAFEMGRQKVKTSHHMDRGVAQLEVEKFVLLPKGGDHDVKIFDSERPPSSLRLISEHERLLMCNRQTGILPLPPDDFEGRQVEMHCVLAALQTTRILRITGAEGIGKSAVAQGVCQHIRKRHLIFNNTISDIVWLDFNDDDGTVDYSSLLDDDSQRCRNFSASSREQVINCLKEKQVLLVVDAGKALRDTMFQELEELLGDIIMYTRDTRVIVIERFDRAGMIKKLTIMDREIHVKPLSFLATLCLFGKLCPHVQAGRRAEVTDLKGFRRFVLPDGPMIDELDTQTGREFFEMMGEGNPTLIQQKASTITVEEYDRLLKLGEKLKKVQKWKHDLQAPTLKFLSEKELNKNIVRVEEKIQIEGMATGSQDSRFDLEKRLESLQEDFLVALEEPILEQAKRIQSEMLLVKESLRLKPSLDELKTETDKAYKAYKDAYSKAKENSDHSDLDVVQILRGWVHRAEAKFAKETQARFPVNTESREEVSLKKGESVAGGLVEKSQAAFGGWRQRLKPTPLGKSAYTNKSPSQSLKKSGFGCK